MFVFGEGCVQESWDGMFRAGWVDARKTATQVTWSNEAEGEWASATV